MDTYNHNLNINDNQTVVDNDPFESLILKFCKMHGSANDFVIFHIDHLRMEHNGQSYLPSLAILQKITQSLCNRTTGVGADQVLVITPPPEDIASDYQVLIFNSDGSIAENCANGLTCVTKFIIDYDIRSYARIQQEQQNLSMEQLQEQQQLQQQQYRQLPYQSQQRDLRTFSSATNSQRLRSSLDSPYKGKSAISMTINTIAGIQHCYSLPSHQLNNSKTLWVKVSMGKPLVLRTNTDPNNISSTTSTADIDVENFLPYSIFNVELNNQQQQQILAQQQQQYHTQLSSSPSSHYGVGGGSGFFGRKHKTLSINSKFEEYSKMIQCGSHYIDSTVVSMGNPHCVLHLENVEEFPLDHFGKVIETHPLFPEKTNVEFAQVKSKDLIRVRVWQRGCGVTSACGTGAAAVLVSGVLRGKNNRKATVVMDGGDMEVEWREHDDAVFISAPAVTIFEGSLRIFMDELIENNNNNNSNNNIDLNTTNDS
ncbi:diaminopimelate epimerase [Tieghemostelium lacteum]|uniref:Diaminopimelate epimerase n=1 Tax=Tieghemostelium lacteum TaxID=361077 RepID=A0A151ZCX6_TIELA|nr:diaminopimelate epimerase [Tieghemostelium lacteum]|eukprot:KYQ91803.1 diaminopimelate epimerase [Tieghemostelium lacteum]